MSRRTIATAWDCAIGMLVLIAFLAFILACSGFAHGWVR